MTMTASTFLVSMRSWIWDDCFCASLSAEAKSTLSPCVAAAFLIPSSSAFRMSLSWSKLTPMVSALLAAPVLVEGAAPVVGAGAAAEVGLVPAAEAAAAVWLVVAAAFGVEEEELQAFRASMA